MPEYEVFDDGEASADGARGQRGWRPVPHVGAGLAVCVDCDADGLGFGDVVVAVGFGFGAVVVAVGSGFGSVVVTESCVPVGFGSRVGRDVARGFAVADGNGGFVDGTTLGLPPCGDGLSLTLTWRLERSLPPNVVGITLSGSAWKPMNASMPVATVASMTMTMLDSSDPRCAFGRVTAATSPWCVRAGLPLFFFGRNLN